MENDNDLLKRIIPNTHIKSNRKSIAICQVVIKKYEIILRHSMPSMCSLRAFGIQHTVLWIKRYHYWSILTSLALYSRKNPNSKRKNYILFRYGKRNTCFQKVKLNPEKALCLLGRLTYLDQKFRLGLLLSSQDGTTIILTIKNKNPLHKE